MKFNENLKYLRKKEGLTQEELAEKLNVSRQSVTKWESGQALPDIEKIKEISYMFSVSVDSLIGDIESKTTNKIKKKIDDIEWFIFGLAVMAIAVISSISNLIFETIQNEDISFMITIVMIIITVIIIISMLKKYLKDNNEKILNMKNNKEGKKERVTYLIKEFIYGFFGWVVFSLMSRVSFLTDSVELFAHSVIGLIIRGFILCLILFTYEYIKLEKTVKKINKDEK